MHQVNMVRSLNPLALFNQGAELGRPDQRAANPRRRRKGGHGRRRHNIEENPSPGTWLLIMGASAAVVGGGIALALRGKKSPTVPGGGGGGTVPGGGGGGTRPGGGGGSGTGTYVGDPKGYNWPNKGMFPTEGSFGAALEQLGYNVGNWEAPNYSVIKQPTYAAIGQFQRDWNIYRANIAQPWAPQLGSDSLLGPNTIKALAGAKEAVDELGLDWQAAIAALRSQVT